MFFVIPSNKAKKEAEEDLFLHDKNATLHSVSFHENFILFSMVIQQNSLINIWPNFNAHFHGEKLNPNSASVHQNKQSKQSDCKSSRS